MLRPELLRLPKNESGRDFVVGDIHGYVSRLMQQLDVVGFNPLTDRVICTGDLIDRGPESADALNLLDEDWFYSVMGNHEYLMLSALKGKNSRDKMTWLNQGGSWIASTSPELWAHWFELLEALPLAIEVQGHDDKTYGIVHADYPHAQWSEFAYLTPEQQQKCIWSRRHFESRSPHVVNGVDYLIHGHSVIGESDRDGGLQLGNRIYIEPGVYLGQDFIIRGI
ncbi:MAG: metallophosphoesterase [Oceanospirillaceae bacterium]|uniref:metallophosphoesterase n=1 Tax=Thalassolituus sp. UBA1505 TaxID=1947653 RepID=UPI000C4E6059|nr:metallophosphoesterase [Thalassolituus sp. UBA1505]MBS52815.1 metallophosphoesterase [Oceanospirillaceae bacterium]|tara:strand:+ start:2678 stop:3349 length:672 start_codon:yes stop_codon:yes gene_type:complete